MGIYSRKRHFEIYCVRITTFQTGKLDASIEKGWFDLIWFVLLLDYLFQQNGFQLGIFSTIVFYDDINNAVKRHAKLVYSMNKIMLHI